MKILLTIILPSTPWSPQWSLSVRFLHQNSVHASPLPHTRYMPRLSHTSRFYHQHNSGTSCWRTIQRSLSIVLKRQGAYKLSEYFAKPYFQKYWTEIHDVTAIWKRNVCIFIVTLMRSMCALNRHETVTSRKFQDTPTTLGRWGSYFPPTLVYAFPARWQ
jgi:hypothetical protein